MIKIDDVHRSFNGTEVLSGASFEVEKGEMLAVIGSSGEGKSVLLRHTAGLMRPDSGRVVVDGQDLCCLSGRRLVKMWRKFGFLFQSNALFGSMSVFDNVAFPLREKTRLSSAEIKDRVLHELEGVGLPEARNKYPAEISGGMARRVALARCLILSPEIMFFDEPTTGLDPMIAHSILNLIESCHKRHKFTGIIVTHQIPAAFSIVQKVAMLYQGAIQIVGEPKEVLASTDPVVARFIRGSTLMTIYRGGLFTMPNAFDHIPGTRHNRDKAQQEDEGVQ